MRKRLPFIAAAAIASLGLGCEDPPPKPPVTSSSGAPPGSGGGGGGGGGSSGETPDDGTPDRDAGVCTDLPVSGPVIAQQVVNATPPPGTGGEILDGTYELTDATYYGGPSALPGPSGTDYQGAIRIAGQTFERHVVITTASGATAESVQSGSFTTNGINGLITWTCPITAQEQVTYTVNGNNLVITNIVTNESFGYTRTQ